MSNTNTTQNEQIKYSKLLSSLLCSSSIVVLSILSLLNNFSIDIYSTFALLKIVAPAGFCFWFIGFSIGKILDGFSKKLTVQKTESEKEAYEIPSMFAATENMVDDEFGAI